MYMCMYLSVVYMYVCIYVHVVFIATQGNSA